MLQTGGRGGVSQRGESTRGGGESGGFAADLWAGGYSFHDDVALFGDTAMHWEGNWTTAHGGV